MALKISVVVLLLIVVILLIRKSGLKGWHALWCVLLGFYLADSSIAPSISDLTNNIAGVLGDLKL